MPGAMDCTGKLKRRGRISASASELKMECLEELPVMETMRCGTMLCEECEEECGFGCLPLEGLEVTSVATGVIMGVITGVTTGVTTGILEGEEMAESRV